MSELDEYKHQMAAANSNHAASWAADREKIVELEAEVARLVDQYDTLMREKVAVEEEAERLRGERREAIRALVYACHSGGMDLSEYVPDCLMADAVERERRVDAALEGRE